MQSLSVTPEVPLRPGSEFHLSCSASSGGGGGGGWVAFRWFKDDRYRVDTEMADR